MSRPRPSPLGPSPKRSDSDRRGSRFARAQRSAWLVAALLVAVTGAATAAGSRPASADPVTGVACGPGEGVTVVVDFSSLGGGVRIGCAPGEQATGFSALTAAGFARDSGPVAGSVCTIDGLPAEGYPYCWSTGGYWSYWKKARGGAWGFASVGGGAGPVPVDAVEGWSWAGGFTATAPRADETSAPPPSTTTTTTTSTSTTTTPPMSTSTSTSLPTSTSEVASTIAGPGPTTSVPDAAPVDPSPTITGTAADPEAPGASPGGGVELGSDGRSPADEGRALPRTGTDAALLVALALSAVGSGGAVVAATARTRRAAPRTRRRTPR